VKHEKIEQEYVMRKPLAEELGARLRGKPFVEQTLIDWEKRGVGPPVIRVGRGVYYRRQSVEAWLRAQEEHVTA
jgi:hypothetical protein